MLATVVAGCSTGGVATREPLTVTATVTATVTVGGGPAPSEPGEAATSEPAAATIDAAVHVDACDLLTQTEANALADLELQPAVGAGDDHGKHTECVYTRDPNLSGTAQVTLLAGDGAKKALDIDKDTLHHTFTQVPGIGDEAWEEDDEIFIRVGTLWAAVELVLLNDPKDNVTRLEEAGKIAAGRM